MPYSFEIDDERQLIRKRVWGVYDNDQARKASEAFAAIDVHEIYDELHDLLAVSSYEVTSQTLTDLAIESLAMEHADYKSKKVAVVVPHDLLYGMARIYQAFHEGSKEELKIFRTLEQAEHWLFEAK